MEQRRLVCGEDYLLRCLASGGLDEARARVMLEALPDYVWRDSRFPR